MEATAGKSASLQAFILLFRKKTYTEEGIKQRDTRVLYWQTTLQEDKTPIKCELNPLFRIIRFFFPLGQITDI